mgnify:CR=1 FL=1
MCRAREPNHTHRNTERIAENLLYHNKYKQRQCAEDLAPDCQALQLNLFAFVLKMKRLFVFPSLCKTIRRRLALQLKHPRRTICITLHDVEE